MNDLKPTIQDESSATTVIVSGPFNASVVSQPTPLGPYSSMSYTVGEVNEAADSEPQGAPSKPVNASAVKVLDSVLRSRLPESAVLRETGEEL